jgi:hypothetical protein
MKRIGMPLFVVFFLSSTILCCAFAVFAESQVFFSGKWSFNQARSKAAEGTSFSGSEVTLDILQDQKSIKITKTIKNPGGMVDTTSETYTLDGKEHVTKETSLITERTGNWSDDKKQIVLVQRVSLGARVFTTEDVYSLSDDGKVLMIHSAETMNSRKGKSLLVYDKQ